MKKLISIFIMLSMMLCLCACGGNKGEGTSPPETIQATATLPNETTAPETTEEISPIPTHAIGVYDGCLTLGNIRFDLPQGFQPQMVGEQTYLLFSENAECYFGVFANDISALTHEELVQFLPKQREIFRSEDAVQMDETIIDGYVAGCDIPINYYGEIDDDLEITSNMDMIFADSHYAYTILFVCDAGSEKMNEYINAFVEFTAFAEHLMGETQYTFIQ